MMAPDFKTWQVFQTGNKLLLVVCLGASPGRFVTIVIGENPMGIGGGIRL